MKTLYKASQPAILSAALLVTACSSSSDPTLSPSEGRISLSLIDAPVTDVSEIQLEIDSIRLKPVDAEAIEFDFDPDIRVDLLSLTPDNASVLLDNEPVPVGEYEWIRLEANAEFDSVIDSYVVEASTGGQVELRVPSGSVRLVSGLTVTAGANIRLMIDWNTRKGLVRPPGQPGYMLRPAFRVIDMATYGSLSGMVAMDLITPATEENGCNADSPEENPDVGNVVYVFAGPGRTPDDIDGIDEATDPNTDPVATLDVAQDESGDYRYSTIIAPGEYTLAFTCQAGLDDPETDDELLFSDPVDVTIEADDELIIDF